MIKKLVCMECGSDDIEELQWVSANTGEISGGINDTEVEDQWCNNCNEHVEFCTEEEYKNNKQTN